MASQYTYNAAGQDIEITDSGASILRPKGYTASKNQPSVITSTAANQSLNNIKTDLNNWTTGIQNQNAINAANAAAAAAAKQQTTLNQQTNNAALTQAGDKNKTALLLEELKAKLASGAKDTSTYGAEKSATSDLTKAQELEAAYKRIQAGNPSEEDLTNVEYAKNKGWVPGQPIPTDVTGTTGAPKVEAGPVAGPAVENKTDRTKYDINGNPLYNADGTPTQYKAIQDEEDKATSYRNKMESIINGTFVLSPEEQSQVTAMRDMYDRMIEEQRVANTNFQGVTEKMGVVSGRSRYAGEEQVAIANDAIAKGTRKIADLEASALANIANLKDAIKSKNYKMIEGMYNSIQDDLANKRKAIADTNAAVRQAAKDAEDLQTQNLNQQKLQADIAETTVAPILMNSLTGDPVQDQQTVKDLSEYYNIPENTLIGAYSALEAKKTAEEAKLEAQRVKDEAAANKLTKTVYKGVVTWWNAKGQQVNPDGTPTVKKTVPITPKVTPFTASEKKKLEQAGLINADRQTQLNYLYTPTTEKKQEKEIKNAQAKLSTGAKWGETYNEMKKKYPELHVALTPEEKAQYPGNETLLDVYLGKTQYYNQ